MTSASFASRSVLLASLGFFSSAHAANIAVTDLTYAQTVNQYFRDIHYQETQNAMPSNAYNYIEYNELHKFEGDIRDELVNNGFQITQATPHATQKNEKVTDVIEQIKSGHFLNADYVLFGIVSDLAFRDEATPVMETTRVANTFSLMLSVDFSLINTKTYEVKTAFSASTQGQDTRQGNADRAIIPDRGKIISEISRNLGKEVAQQILFQLGSQQQ